MHQSLFLAKNPGEYRYIVLESIKLSHLPTQVEEKIMLVNELDESVKEAIT